MSQLDASDLAVPVIPPPSAPSIPAIDLAPSPESADTARDQAFLAVPFRLHGQELRPFALGVEAFFFEHRRAIMAPPFTLFPADPRGILADAVRLFYLLSHEPAIWLRTRAVRLDISLNSHLVLEQQMMEWADQHLQADADSLTEYLDTIQQIFERSRLTRVSAAGSGSGGSMGK